MYPHSTKTMTKRYLVNSFKEKNQLLVCTICNGKAVFMCPYSGEKLCKRCLCKFIENKTRVTIFKYDMLKPDDKIVLAVSGGKDSLTLLHILARKKKVFPEATLCAVTINEGIEGY
jgi:hypothetical protein